MTHCESSCCANDVTTGVVMVAISGVAGQQINRVIVCAHLRRAWEHLSRLWLTALEAKLKAEAEYAMVSVP